MTYRFSAPLWKWKGEGPWHFVTLPFEQSDEIDERTAHVQRGFGSVKVTVTVGRTTWSTSLFPASTQESYILPVKAAVRKAEGLTDGAMVDVLLALVDI
ncbi:MAG: hypothetical protein RJA49_1276 [Actinomycetota bacterium]